ncbi:helix-turn-helix domain-containing protein [Gordonia sp. ABSL11-1]|uniref:TetR/AcrR family transcriptional regulator n=1 Tax=Gordonia sp. ABSL11-1 TaxID=3053924 RepID=UPI0025726CFD|nr:helix-turn-helix domain-containing protein [Gordonia sp. ABSL11-1]MDL9947125.1 helix-turn-helix domain-containing protein [Gordonia sp. ABSL11-1]
MSATDQGDTEGLASAVEWTPKARIILDAASTLFYEHGIHAVGVETIAAEAGVTKRTLYDRFGSKEHLVVEYLRARDDRWRLFLQGRLDAADDSPEQQLTAVFDASRVWAADHGPKGCSMINAHAEISDPTHPAYAIIVGQKQWMLDLFTTIARDASAHNTALVGERLLLLHEGALVTAGMGVTADAFDVACEVAVEVLRQA